jgi:hypothetical protein
MIPIILPSDSSMDHFPDNKISDYRVMLNRPIDLDARFKWQVAVKSITYPLQLTTSTKDNEIDNRLFVYCDLVHGEDTFMLYSMKDGSREYGIIYDFLPPPPLPVSGVGDGAHEMHSKYTLYWANVSSRKVLRDVHIRIVDINNRPVHFTHGRVVLSMLMRKRL